MTQRVTAAIRRLALLCLLPALAAGCTAEAVWAPQEEVSRAIAEFPHNREALFTFDTIILGDVDPDGFTQSDLQILTGLRGQAFFQLYQEKGILNRLKRIVKFVCHRSN